MMQEHVSLKAYNTFGIDAFARFLVEVNSVEELKEVLSDDRFQNTPQLVIGGGSNVLLTRDFEGLVIVNSIKHIKVLSEDSDSVVLESGAGEVWHDLVMFCVDKGWGGIENLSLIPGSVGAAPMQNIGAYGVEIKDVFVQLSALNLQTLEEETFTNEDCQFGYRESIFKRNLKGKHIITSIQLKLSKEPTVNTSYGAIETELSIAGISKPSIQDVSTAVIKIRQSKLPDPALLGNAGSFFKNPVVDISKFEELKVSHPSIPNYPAPGGVKLAAGWLVEQCGWKGKQIGNCGSHEKQALVIVNYGGSTGSEIFHLSEEILQSVKKEFGIQLEREVNVV